MGLRLREAGPIWRAERHLAYTSSLDFFVLRRRPLNVPFRAIINQR